MTLDLREILKAPLHISANPHFYDYIHWVKLSDDGAVEMIAGSGQALHRRIVGKWRLLDPTPSEATLHFFDLLDTDPYERRPDTAKVDDMAVRVAIEAGPFALRCGVVWNVTEEDWPFLLYDYRLVLSEDPLSAGEKPLPPELLEHPDLPAETRELFESMKRSAEERRRYYKDGVELKHREILGMGLPASAIIE